MPPSELERQERLQIMLSAEELTALDNWRFSHRMPSRAAAVRELLRLGLKAQGVSLANSGEKSSSFGMLGHAPAHDENQDDRE